MNMIYRQDRDRPLTHAEMDGNLKNLAELSSLQIYQTLPKPEKNQLALYDRGGDTMVVFYDSRKETWHYVNGEVV